MTLPERRVVMAWVGRSVLDRAGRELGVCTAVLTDDDGAARWLAVDVAGQTAFVPVRGAAESAGTVRVAVRHEDVARAPAAGSAGGLSEEEQSTLSPALPEDARCA